MRLWRRYVPPEVLLTQESDTKVDLWSLGCVAYELFAGKTPFKEKEGQSVYERVLLGDLEFPKDFPELARDLCLRLIRLEKDKRLGADEFAKLKEHKFFWGIDFDNLRETNIADIEGGLTSCECSPKNSSIISDEGVNYAVMSSPKSYNVEADYFGQFSKGLHSASTTDCREHAVLKEGTVRKKCGWVFYQKVRLVLGDEPRLSYFSVDNVYKVLSHFPAKPNRARCRCSVRLRRSGETWTDLT